MPYLLYKQKGEERRVEIPLDRPITIGRSQTCSLCMPDNTSASRNHCSIFMSENGECFLSDLNSMNGTGLNGKFISTPSLLSHGDVITVGTELVYFQTDDTNKVSAVSADPVLSEEDFIIAPGTVIDDYVVHKFLRRTETSNLYQLAPRTDPACSNFCMKIYKKPVDGHAFELFRETISALANPPEGIMPYISYGYYESRCYYVTTHFDSADLAFRISQKAPMSEAESLPIIRNTAKILASAHDKFHTLHGDVKPSNIIYTQNNKMMMMEYGLYKWESAVLADGHSCSSPWYTSPEQISGGRVNWASDQYSLGIILFQMLTGVLPFHSTNMTELLGMQLYKPFPYPKERNPNISSSAKVVLLLQQMTEKDPSDRVESWKELLELLKT